MREVVKPCPFCGSEPNYKTFHDGFIRWHRIECPFCKVFLSRFEKEDAIAAWNKRKDSKIHD
jgi:Lar family restriction alleviation protein